MLHLFSTDSHFADRKTTGLLLTPRYNADSKVLWLCKDHLIFAYIYGQGV